MPVMACRPLLAVAGGCADSERTLQRRPPKTLVSVGFHAFVKKGVGTLEVRRRDSKHWRKLATALPMEASGQDPFSRLPVTALCARTAVAREARRHDKAWIE